MAIAVGDVRAAAGAAVVMGGGAWAVTRVAPIGNDYKNGFPKGGSPEASDWKLAAGLGVFGAVGGIGMGLVGAAPSNIPRSALGGAMLLGSAGCAAVGVGVALGLGMRD